MFKGNDGYCLLQVIDKALTVLKTLPPNMTVIPQQSPMQIDHTVFYREQAWLVVQVMIIETLRLDYPSLFFMLTSFCTTPKTAYRHLLFEAGDVCNPATVSII